MTALSTVEYRYPVQPNIAAYLFVDAGRVFNEWSELEFDGMRVGFGGGIHLMTKSAFLLSLQLASSIDGGFQFSFVAQGSDSPGATH